MTTSMDESAVEALAQKRDDLAADVAQGSPSATRNDHVTILYTNWKGRTAVRRIVPAPPPDLLGAWYHGACEPWHPEPQWLMRALDVDLEEYRVFAVSGVRAWGVEAVDAALTAAQPAPPAASEVTEALRTFYGYGPGQFPDQTPPALLTWGVAVGRLRAALATATRGGQGVGEREALEWIAQDRELSVAQLQDVARRALPRASSTLEQGNGSPRVAAVDTGELRDEMISAASAAIWNGYLYDVDSIEFATAPAGNKHRAANLSDADLLAALAVDAALATVPGPVASGETPAPEGR